MQDGEGERRLVPALLRESTLALLREVHGKMASPLTIQRALLGRLHRYVPVSGAEQALPKSDGFSGDALCIAQHHGLPTLLLDWTLNPQAALYFAVTKHKSQDGRVWWMRLKPPSERIECTVHLEERVKLIENTAVPTLVVPRPFSRRIEAQVGRFIYFGSYEGALEDYASLLANPHPPPAPFQELEAFRVQADSKNEIQRELAHLQVHGGTMFPGIDGYARYLAEGGL